jgi:hypothetical protein
MKLFKYFFLFLVVGMLFNACKDLEEINVDPTRTADAPLDLLLPETTAQIMFNKGTNPWRVAGIIMQQFVGTDAQQLAYNDYNLEENTFNNYWRTGLYVGSLKSAQVIFDQAEEQGNSNFYKGVAKVIMANEYGTATSMFGDIPLTEALQGLDVLQPVYDMQENVYPAVQAMLDEAIVDLNNSAGEVTGGDLIHNGSAAAWIQTAYALKARYAFHLTKRDPNKASQDALSAIANAFTSAADQPTFTFGTAQTDNWGLAKFGNDRPNTLGIDDRFADLMMNRADPRMSVFMFGEPGAWQYYGEPEMVWAQNNSTIPLISLAELKFIEAEAIVRTGGSDADASAALECALYESFALSGVDADTAFIQGQAALSGTMEEKIQHIVEEAYVSYYGYNFIQTWVNFRRTGYPNLTPSPTASPGLDPSGVVPERYLYPDSETQSNGANADAARARQGGGLLDAPMWAFQ